jgi:hypothetical protein
MIAMKRYPTLVSWQRKSKISPPVSLRGYGTWASI